MHNEVTVTTAKPPRKPYRKPVLTKYGDVRELTRTTTGGTNKDIKQFGSHTTT